MKKLFYFLLIICLYQQDICMHSSESTASSKSFPLHDACAKGDIERLKDLVAQPNRDVDEGDSWNDAPLYVACENNQLACVKLLLATPGVDVNKNNWKIHSQTPFWIAVTKGHEDIIDILASNEAVDIWYIKPVDCVNGSDYLRTKVHCHWTDRPTGVLMEYQQVQQDYDTLQNMQKSLEEVRNCYKSLAKTDQESLFSYDYLWKWLQQESYQETWFTQCVFPPKRKELSKIENKLHYLLYVIVLYKRYNEERMSSIMADYKTTYKKCHPEPAVALEQDNVRLEKKLHHQVRASRKRMPCALFMNFLHRMGIQSNTDPAMLIAHYYCYLNNELIVAWFYRKDPYYYALPEEQRERIKNVLSYKNTKCLNSLWACKR